MDHVERSELDDDATAAKRKAIRKARIADSVPTREWMKGEREKILAKNAGDHVKQMFAASFKLGPRFYSEFKAFWNLPADWTLTEEEIGVPHYGSHYSMDVSELPDVKTVQFVEE